MKVSVDSRLDVSRTHCLCGDKEYYIHGDIVGGTRERDNEELKQEDFDIVSQLDRDRYCRSAEHHMGIYRRDYVFHRVGSPRPQKVVEKERQRVRKSSRCNCNTKMAVAREIIDGITHWKVVYFDNVHNHELLNDKEVKYLHAYRNIEFIDQKRISLLAKTGCSISLIRKLLELEKGVDVGQLTFTKKDIRNFLQSESSTVMDKESLR